MDHYVVHYNLIMKISVSDAKAQLTELVRRAEAGDEVVLTRHGQPAVRLTPIKAVGDAKARLRLMEDLSRKASEKVLPGADAARSQDFLYDDDGLPG